MYFDGMDKGKNGVAINYILRCGGISLLAVALWLAGQGLWDTNYGPKRGRNEHSP